MAARLAVETTLSGADLAKALSATALELGVADGVLRRLQKAVLAPLPEPPEGPWPDPRQQQIEDWVTGHAEAAVQEWVDGQVRWVHLNWTPEPLQLPPPTRMHAPWWMLALGLVALPVLVQQGASWRVATDWVEGVAPGTFPRWPSTPIPMPRTLTPKRLRPIIEDIAARMERWADTIADVTRTVWTQGRRLGQTAQEVQQGLRAHFTGWSQDFGRLIRTEVAAGWQNATLATTDALYGTIRVHPDACPECHRLLEGQRFRLFKHVPEDRAAWEHTAFWPDKWLLNWDRPKEDWLPAIPQHASCRCTLRVEKSPRKKG